ncbi:MAG: Gldg family protein [Limisphaerales bacterium]
MADKRQPSFSPGRRWKIGFDVVLRTALVLAVVVMVNYLGAKFPWRFYLSSQTQTLSPRSLSIVHAITNRVNVTVYYNKNDDWYPAIIALLNEYRTANPNISVKAVDYVLDAGEAQKTKEQYKLTSTKDKDLIIFECEGRVKVIPGEALSQVKLEQVPNATEREFRRKPVAFNGEMAFTSMLIAVENPKPLKAYFLQGHGEPSLSDSGETDYQKFGSALAESYIATVPLQLIGTNTIPDDCNLLIIAGPRAAFPETEIQKIDQYLAQGGRLFMLFNYFSVAHPTGLEPVFARWGVQVIPDTVVDPANTTSGQDVIVSNFSSHPTVNPLITFRLQMVLPRPVMKVDWKNPPVNAPKVDEIAFSGPESVLKGNPTAAARSYPLMVAVEQKPVPGAPNTRGTMRMIVVGDSFFLGNHYIDGGANRDFAGYAANWLLDRSVLLEGIGPRPVTEYRLTITQAQLQQVRWLLLATLPGGVLVFGWLVWLVRRK